MFGCEDVIPQKLKDADKAWAGTDNASSLMRKKKLVQYWLAVGPLCYHWYCRTEELPRTLFVAHGKGPLRYESSDGKIVSDKPAENLYLSRIQCWTRWNVTIQWPLLFFCHMFWFKKSVVQYPAYKSSHGILKLISFLIFWKRDADRWHIPTIFLGGNFE